MKNRLPICWLLSVSLALLFSGCATYTDKTKNLRANWQMGNYQGASQIAADAASKSSSTDVVLWDLEAGATARASGNTDASMASLNAADKLFDYWDTQPDISISRETASLLVNPTVLPYRGEDHDRIMESTYQALNYLQLGKYNEARVELTRALERQRTALQNNAARIEKAQQAAAESAQDGGYNAQRAQQDPHFQQQLQQITGPLAGMHFYSNYVNPFTTYLQGVCLLANPQSAADLESARVDFERVRAMIGPNPAIDADDDLATKTSNGAAWTPQTWVIFETGTAPDKEEVRIDIPVFLVSRDVPYFGAAFPRLRFNGLFDSALVAQAAGGVPLRTTLVCDMDAVIGLEFRNEMPDLVVKTLISSGAKAAAAFGLHEAARAADKHNDLLNALTQVTGLAYEYATNRADLRTWVTLPKQFQFCRLPTPADRKLYLARDGSRESVEVDLPPGPATMVYVKSSTAGGHLAITTFPLR